MLLQLFDAVLCNRGLFFLAKDGTIDVSLPFFPLPIKYIIEV